MSAFVRTGSFFGTCWWTYHSTSPTGQMLDVLQNLRRVPGTRTDSIGCDGPHVTLSSYGVSGGYQTYSWVQFLECFAVPILDDSFKHLLATLPHCTSLEETLEEGTSPELAPTLDANGWGAPVRTQTQVFFAVDVSEGESRLIAFERCSGLQVEVSSADGLVAQFVPVEETDCPEIELTDSPRHLIAVRPAGGASAPSGWSMWKKQIRHGATRRPDIVSAGARAGRVGGVR